MLSEMILGENMIQNTEEMKMEHVVNAKTMAYIQRKLSAHLGTIARTIV